MFGLFWLGACQVAATTPPLSHGPIVGAVTENSVSIWLRTHDAARVQIEYGKDAALQSVLKSETVTTEASSDFTTIVKIPDLAPQQIYFYNVRVNDAPQFTAPFPQFKTFPARGDAQPFRFVFLTDFRTVSRINQNVETFKRAAQENPAFVIIGGDFDHRNPTTLEEKRAMFRELYTPTNGLDDFVNLILKKFPLIHFWDDHDYGDNNADKTYPHKEISLRVLRESFPLYPISEHGDWQMFSYGDADFFILDARMQRDPARETDSAEKSMLDGDNLGDAGQRAWLLNALKNSRARWKFILSPVTFNPTTKVNDAWGAYPTERKMILDFLRENHISNVIVLSGDLHAGALDDGTNAGLPELAAPTANDGFDKRCLTDAAGNVGKWSIGSFGDASGAPCNGYAVVEVSDERVVLRVKDSQGETRLEHEVKSQK